MDIPVNPADSYEKIGWQGWAHFLGTKNQKAGTIKYRDFNAAREWTQAQGLQSQAEWNALVRSGRLPPDIPARPGHVYRTKGWITIGDWLGKGERHSKNRQWRPFANARDYVRALGLRNGREWQDFCTSGRLLRDIPADPRTVYKDDGWKSLGDWLGTRVIASTKREFLSFEDARQRVRAIGFRTKTEYEEWARSDRRPIEIPALPSRTYAANGWRGWGDWLGTFQRWNKTSILAFVSSLAPVLHRLQPSELYAILRQNGCLAAVDSLPSSSPLRQLVHAALHEDKEALDRSLRELGLEETDEDEIELTSDGDSDVVLETAIPSATDDLRLPDLSPADILSGLDDLERSVVLSDTETIEFLINKAIGRLWSRVLRSETLETDLAKVDSHEPTSYGSRVRQRFLEQFNGATSLLIPKGYSFRKDGQPLLPNLMQRLIAYRVAVERRVGNWSGTGAGKTLGAILASRVIEAKVVVVVALNNTIERRTTDARGLDHRAHLQGPSRLRERE